MPQGIVVLIPRHTRASNTLTFAKFRARFSNRSKQKDAWPGHTSSPGSHAFRTLRYFVTAFLSSVNYINYSPQSPDVFLGDERLSAGKSGRLSCITAVVEYCRIAIGFEGARYGCSLGPLMSPGRISFPHTLFRVPSISADVRSGQIFPHRNGRQFRHWRTHPRCPGPDLHKWAIVPAYWA